MAGPVGVEELAPGGVGALVGVGAEVVPLGLEQVGGEPGRGVAVEVAEGGGEGGHRDAGLDSVSHHLPPRGNQALDGLTEVPVQQQILQPGVLVVGLLDLPQEHAADDAPAPPHQGDAPVVQVPAVGLGGGAHQGVALGVGDDLAGVEGLADVLDEGGLVPREGRDGPGEGACSGNPLLFHGGQAPGEHRLPDQGQRHPLVQGGDGRPLAGALLAGGVQDVVHHALAVCRLVAQDVPGDLNEVAVQLRLVPGGEGVPHLLVAHPQAVPHELVGLADELHVAVLDTVVDHLHKVARAVLPHPVAAGLAVLHLGADGLEDGLHVGPGRRGPAGHHGGALQRPLLAAGDAGADVQQPLALHVLGPADGVGEVAVAPVDEDVARLQVGDHLLDEVVHRRPGLHHHHDLPGLFQAVRQLPQAVAADDVLPGGPAMDKAVHLLGGAVV